MGKVQNVELEVSNEVVSQEVSKTYNYDELMTQYKTKSSVIRFLSTEGMKRSEIAKFMNIRYQHVRNVLTQPLKKTEG